MGTKQIEEIILKVSIDDSKAEAQLNKYNSAMGQTNKSTSSLTKGLGVLGGVLAAVGFAKIGKEAFNIALQYDKINNSLKTVTGSQAEANSQFKFLNELADELGVSVPSIAAGYTKLFASMKGAGLSVAVTQELTRGVSELSTAMGLTSEDTGGLTRALSQIAAKGKVSTEELQQLAERGVDAFGLASRAMGVSTKEMAKMLSMGEVISADFLPKFGAQMRKEFAGAAADAAGSAQANINRLSNEWNRALVDMGSATHKFIPVLTSLVKGFNNVAEATGETVTGFNLWLDELMGITDQSGAADEAAIKLGASKRRQAAEAKKNAAIVAEETAEQNKLLATMKKLEALNTLGAGFMNAKSLDEMRDKLQLTKSEFEKLKPVILDALSKGIDTTVLTANVKSFVSAFKEDLNTLPEQILKNIKSPFDEVIKEASQMQKALDLSKTLGLNEKEFSKISATLKKALDQNIPIDKIKASIQGLRDLGVFDEKAQIKQVELPKLSGTTFEAGTAAATEFLKNNELEVERNELLKKVVKGVQDGNKNRIITKG
jgi:tape measure domain-containing protein